MICGSWVKGMLGIPENTEEYLMEFTLVPSLKGKTVIMAACGMYHSICLTKNREVYQWGELLG